MTIFRKYRQQFIEWIAFDPDNPFMPYDPRTPDMAKLSQKKITQNFNRAIEEEKTILDVLIFDIRRICCRLYYLRKLKLEKRVAHNSRYTQ